jgi:peptidoglycan L-alanyl-D-glutamate endopeptidase CwlK
VVRDPAILIEQDLAAEKIPLKIFECFRHPERQAQLFAQGRSKEPPYSTMKVVTHAQAWHGAHGYGLAVDYNAWIDGKWAFVNNREWTAALREIGEKYGLLPIRNREGKLIDPPHLQWKGWSQKACIAGDYPDGWDDSWEQNFESAILRWGHAPKTVLGIVHPAAPPAVPSHVGADDE